MTYCKNSEKNNNDRNNCCGVTAWRNKEDRGKELDYLLQSQGAVDTASFLARTEHENGFEIAAYLKDAASLSCTRKEIKTIASYYFSIVNGGLQRNRCRLARLWEEMGYKVIILSDFEPDPDDYDLPESIERVMVPDYRNVTYDSYYARAEAFRSIIQKYNIDLVVYQAWTMHLMLWDEIIVKSTGCAFVASTHNIFSLPVIVAHRSFKNLVAPYLLADAVITQNEASTSFWKYYNKNVHTVFNRLPEDADDWEISSCNSHDIVWVGRVSREKNPLDLIPIMQGVKEFFPDVKLHVVGTGKDKEFLEQFIRSITEYHMEDTIVLEGFHKDVKHYYSNASILLVTSCYEGFCNTLLEGLLAGLPVIMYSLPYLTLVKDNPGVIQVPMNDIKSMTQEIISLIRDDERRKQMGIASKQYIKAVSNYDYKGHWKAIINSTLSEAIEVEAKDENEELMLYTLVEHHDIGVKKLYDDINRYRKNLEEMQKELAKYDRRIVRIALKVCKAIDMCRNREFKLLLKKMIGGLCLTHHKR